MLLYWNNERSVAMKTAHQNDKTLHEKQLQCLKLGHRYMKNDMLAGA